MFHHVKQAGARWWPTIILGLFTGRLASESWSALSAPLELWHGWAGALFFSSTALAISFALLRKCNPSRMWPVLFLLLYMVYPVSSLATAITAAALAVAGWVVEWLLSQEEYASSSYAALLPVLLLGLMFLGIYVFTASPGVLPADGGELQLIATKLGVAHPPGFPLFTMLGHLAARLPILGSPAYRLNLMSAVTSALTLVLLHLAVFKLTRSVVASVIAVLTLGSSATFWASATTTNIRSLTGLFAAAAFCALIYFAAETKRSTSEPAGPAIDFRRRDRYLLIFAAAVGFGITHHASLVFISVVFLFFIGVTDPSLMFSPRRWVTPALALAAGTVPLLYLPWRGWVSGRGVPVAGATAALASLDGFLDHVLARGFQGDFFYFMEPAVLWQRFRVIGNVMAFQFSTPLLLGMGLGLLMLFLRQRKIALLLGGSFLIHSFVTATYRAPQTVEYMLPAYFPAAICLGYSVSTLLDLSKRRYLQLGTALSAVVLMAAAIQLFENYQSFSFLRKDTSTTDYTERILQKAPADSVVLADWHWVTPLSYRQQVEGLRPDLSIEFVFPTSEPYADTWARRIREELEHGRSVIATHFDETSYQGLPVPEPLGAAFLFRQEPVQSLPADFQPLTITLGETIQLHGFRLETKEVRVGQEAVMTVAWQPADPSAPEARTFPGSQLFLFAHLVGFDGQIYAQEDPPAFFRPDGLTFTQFNLTPRLGALPGDFAILLGASGEKPLLSSQGQERTQIATLTVIPMRQPPATNHHTSLQAADGESQRTLIGYDWDNSMKGQSRLYLHWQTEQGYVSEVIDNPLPGYAALTDYFGPWGIRRQDWSPTRDSSSSYVPFGQGIIWLGPLLSETSPLRAGDKVLLEQMFVASQPVVRDFATSVRLIGYEEDGFHWAWSDLDNEFGVPAMGGIPTLKWIAGSTILDAHFLKVSDVAYAGQQTGVTLGLYDTFTNQPLPVLDERLSSGVPWKIGVISSEK